MKKKPKRRRRPPPKSDLKYAINPDQAPEYVAHWLALFSEDGPSPVTCSGGPHENAFIVFRDLEVAEQCLIYMRQLMSSKLDIVPDQIPVTLVAMKKPKFRLLTMEQKHVTVTSYEQFVTMFESPENV